jgi:hypothetical protein
MIVEGFQILNGEYGPFLEFPRRFVHGRWLPRVRFRTVVERETFRREVLAALMKAYPEDFEGLSLPTER